MIICFDLDGTLINTEKWIINALMKAYKKHNLKITKEKIAENWGIPTNIMTKRLFPHLKKGEIRSIVLEFEKERTRTINKIKPFKNTKKTLNELSKNYSLALVSNNQHKVINRILKETKIGGKLFNVKIGYDDVKKPKPFPNEIKKAERRLKKKAIFMVGDSKQDIIAAKKAKIKSIILEGGLTPEKDLKNADFRIDDIKKVIDIVSKFTINKTKSL